MRFIAKAGKAHFGYRTKSRRACSGSGSLACRNVFIQAISKTVFKFFHQHQKNVFKHFPRRQKLRSRKSWQIVCDRWFDFFHTASGICFRTYLPSQYIYKDICTNCVYEEIHWVNICLRTYALSWCMYSQLHCALRTMSEDICTESVCVWGQMH